MLSQKRYARVPLTTFDDEPEEVRNICAAVLAGQSFPVIGAMYDMGKQRAAWIWFRALIRHGRTDLLPPYARNMLLGDRTPTRNYRSFGPNARTRRKNLGLRYL